MWSGCNLRWLSTASATFALMVLTVQAWAVAVAGSAVKHGTQAPAPQGKTQKLRNPLNDLLDEAQAALDKNDYEAAIPPLQKFLLEQPDVAYAHFQLGYAYTALKRTAEARAEYERCIALDPRMAEAQLNLGMLLLIPNPGPRRHPWARQLHYSPHRADPGIYWGWRKSVPVILPEQRNRSRV
jgi:tetratricopeptide (TPR) repeat protein